MISEVDTRLLLPSCAPRTATACMKAGKVYLCAKVSGMCPVTSNFFAFLAFNGTLHMYMYLACCRSPAYTDELQTYERTKVIMAVYGL